MSPSRPSTEPRRTGIVLFGDGPHILLPFGTYAKNVLKAKTAAVIYPQATGITESALVIAAGLKKAGIETKAVGYTQGQTDLTAPVDRSRGDNGGLHRPVRLGGRLREPGEGPDSSSASPTRARS